MNIDAKTRKFVENRNYDHSSGVTNPFIEGDLWASQKISSLSQTLKMDSTKVTVPNQQDEPSLKTEPLSPIPEDDYIHGLEEEVSQSFEDKHEDMSGSDWDAGGDTSNNSDSESNSLANEIQKERKPPKRKRPVAKKINRLSSSTLKKRRRSKFICEECPENNFQTLTKLQNHQDRHHNPNFFQCSHCQWSGGTPSSINAHLNKIHNFNSETGPKTGKPSYQCGLCKKLYSSIQTLQCHIIRAHRKKKAESTNATLFKCDHCPKEFKIKLSLTSHLFTAHKIGSGHKRKCYCQFPECGKSYSRIDHLRHHEHREGHQSVGQLKCEICGKGFHNMGRLVGHHNSEHLQGPVEEVPVQVTKNKQPRTSKCTICGVIVTTLALKRHMESVHERKLEVCCDICGQILTSHYYLRKHKAWVHKIGFDEIAKFPCTVEGCKKVCESEYRLKIHIKINHEGDRPFQCEECGKGYTSKQHLRVHIHAIHTNRESKPVKCEVCGRGFAVKDYLRLHMRVHRKKEPTSDNI